MTSVEGWKSRTECRGFQTRSNVEVILKVQMLPKFCRSHSHVDEEPAEFAVTCAHFVEAHFVNDFFQRIDLVRHERATPFPIVETGRAGNELRDASGVFASDASMAAHEFFARSEIN